MALKKTITNIYGIQVKDAYHRVENVSLVSKEGMRFSLRSYKDTEFPYFAEIGFNCPYDLSGANPIEQAYTYVKQQPEFNDAVNC